MPLTDPSPRCRWHPELAAAARCRQCSAPLCDACWTQLADGAPVCAACARRLGRDPSSRWPFALVFLAVAISTCLALAQLSRDPGFRLGLALAAVAAVLLTVVIGPRRKAAATTPVIVERDDARPVSDPMAAGRPYRLAAESFARRTAPLSGRSTAVALAVSMAVTAVAFPGVLHLPHWVEAEIVLLSWWVVLTALSTTLLFRGFELADDHRYRSPELATPKLEKNERPWLEASGCADAASCGEGIFVVVIIALALAAAWLLVELVIPTVFFAVYFLMMRAVGGAANRACKGDLLRSLANGAWLGARAVVPLAVLVVVMHLAWSRFR